MVIAKTCLHNTIVKLTKIVFQLLIDRRSPAVVYLGRLNWESGAVLEPLAVNRYCRTKMTLLQATQTSAIMFVMNTSSCQLQKLKSAKGYHATPSRDTPVIYMGCNRCGPSPHVEVQSHTWRSFHQLIKHCIKSHSINTWAFLDIKVANEHNVHYDWSIFKSGYFNECLCLD